MLADKIRELIDAGFSGLWVQSAEPDEAIAEIRQLASAEGYTIHGTDDAGELTTAPDGDPCRACLTGHAGNGRTDPLDSAKLYDNAGRPSSAAMPTRSSSPPPP